MPKLYGRTLHAPNDSMGQSAASYTLSFIPFGIFRAHDLDVVRIPDREHCGLNSGRIAKNIGRAGCFFPIGITFR